MRTRLARACVVVCLICAVGGHWALLQSVAWVSMAVKFARTDPIPVALAKTFDGKHPCTLCKAVETGKKSERREASLRSSAKLDLLLTQFSLRLYSPAAPAGAPGDSVPASTHAESPPTPPPRLV